MKETILLLRRYAESKFGELSLNQVIYTNRLDAHFNWYNWVVVHLGRQDAIFERERNAI